MAEKKRLLIVGAGAFSRELLGYIRMIPEDQRDFEPVGFLDRNPGALDGYPCDLSVLGDEDSYKIGDDDVFACALTRPEIKLKVCRQMEERGARFLSIIHPTAIIGPYCEIAEGSVICPNVVLTTNVKIGKFVTINFAVGIGHDTVVGEGSTLNPGVQIGGKTKLGEGTFCGSMSAVLEQLEVGDYARIGSGSVAMTRVPAGWTMIGVPARRLHLGVAG